MAKKLKKALPAKYQGYDTAEPQIKELHECFDYATDAWRDIRQEAEIDMRYIGGDPWDPADRAAREEADRPILSLDELGQYTNQIINDIRQHKRAIKVTPEGNGANDKTARLWADYYRQVEYRSNAQQAYITMFENAVNRSYGYLRLKPRYVTPFSRHQEVLIEPIMNPDLVTPDPDAIKPDLADMKYLFYAEAWSRQEFKKKWPKAKVQSFTAEDMALAPRWVKDERVMVAEWWRIKQVKKTALFVDVPAYMGLDGRPVPAQQIDVLEDKYRATIARLALPQGVRAAIVGDREADVPEVSACMTNGIEILQEIPWKGQYVPFVGCFGKIIYVDDGAGPTKKILSAIRLARDPQMLYCYYRTAEAEQVGMSTKFPYFVRRGSLTTGEAAKLAQSVHQPVEYIMVELTGPTIPANVVPEMPVRNAFEPAIAALEAGAEGARRAIQAAMGISPLPTSAQRKNEKSGVALRQIEDSQQKGTFHFVDHYEASVTRVAVILEDLTKNTHDAARDITVRRPDDSLVQVRLNDPGQPITAEDKDLADYGDPGDVPSLLNGDHDFTLSTGPSFDSEREAANDALDLMFQHADKIAAIAGPKAASQIMALAIRAKNLGAFGDEMADAIAPAEDGPQIPPEVQQAMAQAQQKFQELEQENQKLKLEKAGKVVEGQMDIQRQQMADETKKQIAQIQGTFALAVADLKATSEQIQQSQALVAEQARTVVEAMEELRLAKHGHVHEAALAHSTRDQEHGHAKEILALTPKPEPEAPTA